MQPEKPRLALLLVPCALLFASSARAEHFTFRRDMSSGQERGIVVSHGMDLFEITTAAGGIPPVRRAEIIAERLENLANWHTFTPAMFSIGFRNGEVILQQMEHAAHLPHIIVTVDRQMARRAGGDVERLAQWWLALLRDHLSLANGKPPLYSAGTPVGALFQRVYADLGRPMRPVQAEEVMRAVAALPASDREVFAAAARAVPAAYLPDRQITLDTLGPAGAAHHEEEDAEKPEDESERRRRETQAAGMDNGRVKVSGDYIVTLLTKPQLIPVGKPTTVYVKLLNATTGEEIVGGAELRGWFTKERQKPTSPIPAVFDNRAGAYGFDVTFDTAGAYRLTIGAIIADGDVFKVALDLPVGQPEMAKPSTSQSEEKDASPMRLRRSGRYVLLLTLDPTRPVAGRVTEVKIKMSESSETAEGKDAPLTRAKLTAWFVGEGQQIYDASPINAHAGDELDTYAWRVRFADAGRYRMVVEVAPNEGEKFQVEFLIEVSRADVSGR